MVERSAVTRRGTRTLVGLALALSALSGCGKDTADDTASEQVVVPLEGPRLLRRMSLDLTGVLPTLEQLEAVEADPSLIGTYQAEYFEHERFEEQMVYLLAEHWLTTPDKYYIYYYDYDLEEELEYRWERSIGQEPLRLMARVIANDDHWSQAVLADYTMATEITAALWPLEGYPDGGEGWYPVTWTDGRPPVGVLATNGMWWKYTSDDYNSNRSRVAAISRVLTCEDLLLREVAFENTSALLDADDVSEMVRTEPSCLACHSTVEPMAAALFGFQWVTDFNPRELERYHPSREPSGREALGVEMAYWGEPITGLEDLGWAISRDERFYHCMTETMTGLLLRRRVVEADRADVDAVHKTFIDGKARVKELMLAVMDLPSYQAGSLGAGATDDDADREVLARALSPQQLGATIEELTGYKWESAGFDQMDNDDWGYRVLTGGVDGVALSLPVQESTLTSALVIKRLAQAASYTEASSHLGDGGSTLLADVDLSWEPGDAAFEDKVGDIYFGLTALRADSDTLDAYGALWSEVAAMSDATTAWQAVVEGMLREPAFISY